MATKAPLSASEQSHCTEVVCDWMWDYSLTQRVLNVIEMITALFGCYMAGVPRETASEQTHCTQVVCDWMCDYIAWQSAFWMSTEVITALFGCGWCHVKLLPSRRVLCTPYNHAPVYSVILLEAMLIRRMYVFSCNLPLDVWQNDHWANPRYHAIPRKNCFTFS